MRLFLFLAFTVLCFMGSAAIAQVQQTITFEYYPVRPKAGQSIYDQMFEDSIIKHKDQKVVAITDWDIKYSCSYKPLGAGMCEIEEYDVSSVCKTTLPQLITDEKRLNDVFNKYMSYLRKHEQHHCQIAADYADYLEAQLSSLKSSKPMECQALKAAVKSARNTAIIDAKKAHRLFDQQTLENRKKFHAGMHFLGDLFPENP